MTEPKTNTCPFCSMTVSSGSTSCPNCGGAIPKSPDDDGRPSSKPGGANPSAQQTPAGFGQPPSGSPFTSQPQGGFGQPPRPMPQYQQPQNNAGKIIGIIVGILVIVVGISTCLGLAAFWGFSELDDMSEPFSNEPTQLLQLNQPTSGYISQSVQRQIYEFRITQSGPVTISVVGDFDNYLELYRQGDVIPFQENDDGGENLNAEIMTDLTPGTYLAHVRPFSTHSGVTGSFTITARASSLPNFSGIPNNPIQPPPPPSHTPIIQRSFMGNVSSATPNAPVSTGAQCNVILTPGTGQSLNCRLRVICGSTILYGRDEGDRRYGYMRCQTTTDPNGAQSVIGEDTSSSDGDAAVNVNTGAGVVSVRNQGNEGDWTLVIRFTGPAPDPNTPTNSI